jgi:hypothetical protein
LEADVEDQNDSNTCDPSLPPDRHIIFGFIQLGTAAEMISRKKQNKEKKNSAK